MILVKNAHEPIIDEDLFEQVRQMKGQIKKQELKGAFQVQKPQMLSTQNFDL